MSMFSSVKDTVVATKIVATDGSGQFTDIQTAINALPSGGGAVYIKEGTYTLTSKLTITSSNVSLIGSGASTIIKLGNSADDHVLEVGDGTNSYEKIFIAQIQINGNKANNTGTIYGIYFNANISNSVISNCFIHDCNSDNVYLTSSTNNSIADNILEDSGIDGVTLYSNSDKNTISGNLIRNNAGHGINSYDGEYVTIANNVCSSNTKSGISGGPTFAGNNSVIGNSCTSNTEYGIQYQFGAYFSITGNVCINNTKSGIYCILSGKASISANTCTTNGEHGIIIKGTNHLCINGNYVGGNSTSSANSYDGIFLEDGGAGTSCDDNAITGNTSHHADMRYGINEDTANVDWNIIVGNVCKSNGINVNGANTISAHNQV